MDEKNRLNIKAIILDLDQTLINSKVLEPYRNARNWSKVYELIPQCKPYERIEELITFANLNSIKKAIVTSAPSSYAKKVVQYFNWDIELIIGYHDVVHRKPHPEAIEKVVQYFNLVPQNVLSIGDRLIDVQASNAAGCLSGACYWGSSEENELLKSNPSYHFYIVDDLLDIIQQKEYI